MDDQLDYMLAFFQKCIKHRAEVPETDGWIDTIGDCLTEEGFTVTTNEHYVDLANQPDYKDLLDLIVQASHALSFREHSIRWTIRTPKLASGTCVRCYRTVQCYTDPPPNGIDIGGVALAVNCDRPKVKITVEGGVADYEVVSGDVEIEFVDYDNVENGECPHGCGDLEPVFPNDPVIGQVAGEHDPLGHFYLRCPHCGWKDE